MKTRLFIPRLIPLFILASCALPWAVAGQTATGPTIAGKPFSGIWQGTLSPPQGEGLRLLFHIKSNLDGTYFATLDSPDQGTTGIPARVISTDMKAIRINVAAIGAEFTGSLQADGSIDGNWTQRGISLPLVFKRVEKAVDVVRPQMPKPPFPYRVEEVTYASKPEVTLSATLTVPQGQGPFPVALLIPGSGALDRDQTLFGHKPFLVLADYLTRRGIAVLRPDKRGVGRSSGCFIYATDVDFVDDTQAAVSFLKKRKEVNPKFIGMIVGQGEGGIVAAQAAVASPDVAFVVLLASPELPGEQMVLAQQTALLKSRGATEDVIKARRAQQENMLAVVIGEKDAAVAEKKVREMIRDMNPPGTAESVLDNQVKRLLAPSYREFLVYDPRPTLMKIKCPVLAIMGEKDRQIPPHENLAAIQSAMKEGGNNSFTQSLMPGLNHMLQPSQTGSPTEYAKIEITLDPAALQVVGDWIALQVKGR